MARHFALVCDLQPLPDYSDGLSWFGLTLSTGVVVGSQASSQTDLDDLFAGLPTTFSDTPAYHTAVGERLAPLMPWSWKDLEVQFCGFDAANVKVQDFVARIDGPDAILRAVPATAPPPDTASMTALRRQIAATLHQRTEGFSRRDGFRFRIDGQPREQLRQENETRFDWMGFAASLSQQPAPLPHGPFDGRDDALNLTMLVSVAPGLLTNVERLVAAVRFRCPLESAPRIPSAEPVPPATPGEEFVWPYNAPTMGLPPSAAWPVVAYGVGCPLKPVDANDTDYIELKTLLVRAKPEGATAPVIDRDWLRDLPERLAQAFDLPGRMLDAAERLDPPFFQATTPADDETRCTELAKAFFAALRDVAGAGVKTIEQRPDSALTGPDDTNTARTILQACTNADDPKATGLSADAEAVYNALKLYDIQNDLDAWIRLAGESSDAMRALMDASFAGWKETPSGSVVKGLLALARDKRLDALRQVHNTLIEEANLREVLMAHWRLAVAAAPAFFRRHEQLIRQTILPAMSLRQRLGQDNLALAWPAILSAGRPGTGEELRPKLIDAIKRETARYIDERFTVAPAPPPPAQPALAYRDAFRPKALTPVAVPGDWQRLRDEQVKIAGELAALMAPPETGDDGALTPVPHPAVLQIDVVDSDPNARADDGGAGGQQVPDEDPTAALAGFALFMRRKVTGLAADDGWRCLTFGKLLTGKGAGAVTVHPGTLVPFRGGIQYGARQSVVAYDNLPLIGPPPGSYAEMVGDDNVHEPLIRSEIADRPTDPAKLPDAWGLAVALAFGCDYQFVVTCVGNSGALPAGIGRPDYPAILRSRQAGGFKAPGADYIRDLGYRRKVPVGALQVDLEPTKAIGAENAKAFGLATRVRTKAAELIPVRKSTARTPLGDANKICVLAAGAAETLSFTVRPPATDIETFDRWRLFDEFGGTAVWRDRRLKVRTEFFQTAKDRRENTPRDVVTKRAIEDPAVTHLHFVLEELSGAGTGKIERPPLALQWNFTGSGYDVIGASPVTVKCRIGSPASISLSGTTVDVSVPANQVWMLKIAPAVPKAAFAAAARFHPKHIDNVVAAQWGDPVAGDATFHFFDVFQLCIEVASDAMPTPKQLFENLAVAPVGNRMVMSLKGARPPEFDNVGDLDIAWQMHRWDGTPPARLPFDHFAHGSGAAPAGADPTANIGLWDAQQFGARADIDAVRAMRLVPLKSGDIEVFDDLREGDPRAHYYRFAAEAGSRYDVLYPSRVRGRNDADMTWHRGLLKARRAERPTRPSVKLVVPLTQAMPRGADTTSRSLADLLVIVDEKWGLDGGVLAERLEVDTAVATGEYRHGGAIHAVSLPELGGDPILDDRQIAAGGNMIGDLPVLPISGPIGHTFDTDSSAPLFVGTSFVVHAPRNLRTPIESWSMVKLRFRRTVLPEGSVHVRQPLASGQTVTVTTPAWYLEWSGVPRTEIDSIALEAGLDHTASLGRILAAKAAPALLEASWSTIADHLSRQANGRLPLEPATLIHLRLIASHIRDRVENGKIVGVEWDIALLARTGGGDWTRVAGAELFVKADPDPAKPAPPLRLKAICTDEAGNGRAGHHGAFRASEFTNGHWAQFMPDTANIEVDLDFSRVKLVRSGATLAFDQPMHLVTRKTAHDAMWPAAGGRAFVPNQGLFNWVIVTKLIRSADGNPEQEAYVGIFEPVDGSPDLAKVGASDIPDGGRLRARILQMQMSPRHGAGPLADPWTPLFGAPDAVPRDPVAEPASDKTAGTDAELRILKVYPPIDQ